jgi:hypothetical protein
VSLNVRSGSSARCKDPDKQHMAKTISIPEEHHGNDPNPKELRALLQKLVPEDLPASAQPVLDSIRKLAREI